ncbi:hypothetical protein AXF42_Ash017667 [Apostasia shenzhenica]|uniref:Uncharacterized protein n=1 Tax=Apostasia shenzhenica TaxID=1088818 RepID=A0A2I0A5G2_9ASPA|nr:hypothetical protein AXF42_Ash017667 [Apostasia shenzhenica]
MGSLGARLQQNEADFRDPPSLWRKAERNHGATNPEIQGIVKGVSYAVAFNGDGMSELKEVEKVCAWYPPLGTYYAWELHIAFSLVEG